MAKPKDGGGATDKGSKNGEEKSLLDYAPTSVTIDQYVESRAREVMFMVKRYKSTTSTKNTMQNLPRHMRRRAASHNMKRLPRRVRQHAVNEMSGLGVPTKTKRPSRKHRRKPSNLLADYVRRQKRCVWLETHIWHAKRFHMTEKWGYKIPLHPNDKSARASYRANNKFCIMQDISYWCCIEVDGSQEAIVAALNKMTSKEVGPSVEAAACLGGAREGQVILFEVDCYPSRTIGPARYLWCPVISDGQAMTSQQLKENPERQRKLWLWVHPSCHDNVLLQLRKAMAFPDDCSVTPESTTVNGTKVEVSGDNNQNHKETAKPADGSNDQSGKGTKRKAESAGKKSKRQKVETPSVDPRTVTLPLVAHYKHGNTEIISLKDNLVRFKLTGPLSNVVLTDLLKHAKVTPKLEDSEKKWWSKYGNNEGALDTHNEQGNVWQQISTIQAPGELPANCVLGLTVRDPRLLLPRVKTKVAQETDAVAESLPDVCKKWPPSASVSPLWDKEIRDEVKTSKMPDAALNNLRSKQLVPGTDLNLGDEESRVPVILIQRPGYHPTNEMVQESAETGIRNGPGWGSGWDVVLPSGWAMPFWVGLVYRGARTAGLREEGQLSQEMGIPCFPQDFPDTAVGQQYETDKRKELEEKYNRMPPAKRANFTKLGTVAPFHCPWIKLLQERSNPTSEELHQVHVLRNKKQLRSLHKLCLPQSDTNARELNSLESVNTLIPVQVIDLTRGTPHNFSMICLPSAEDYQLLRDDKSSGGPLEKLHKIPKEVKDKSKDKSEKSKTKQKKDRTVDFTVQAVRNSCDREIIGYVSEGGFCLSSGKGAGMGYVAANGLNKLLKGTAHNKQTVVLVREPHSLQYRFAYLSVNLMN